MKSPSYRRPTLLVYKYLHLLLQESTKGRLFHPRPKVTMVTERYRGLITFTIAKGVCVSLYATMGVKGPYIYHRRETIRGYHLG